MADKIVAVLAGNHAQYINFIRDKCRETGRTLIDVEHEYRHIDRYYYAAGIDFASYITIGTFHERKDAQEILRAIRIKK